MSDKPSLLSLPMEIRLRIYSYLDHDDSPIEYPLSKPYCSQISFILTCRQLRYEMQHDFFSNNVFAIKYTKHPSLEELDVMTESLSKINSYKMHSLRLGRLYDISPLESYLQQSFTDLRPFDRCNAICDNLKRIENLELHALHWRLYAIHGRAFTKVIDEYTIKCKEQLETLLEALVHSKHMKGPLELRTLTVVDHVPYTTRAWGGWGYGTQSRLESMAKLKAKLAFVYEPVLTQAAATLGISIKNINVDFHSFPETDCRMKAFGLPATQDGASTEIATRNDAEARA